MAVTSNFCTFLNAPATGCSQRPDWANGSYSATILALGTRISPKLPIPKASELGPLSMCTAIKRNICGYKTSAHVPKPHRTMNAGLFRVKKLLFTPTSPPWAQPLLILKPHVAGAVSKGSFPREYSQVSPPRQPPQICCCHPGVNSGVQTSPWESNISPHCCSGRSQIAQTLKLPAPLWGIQSGIAVTPMPHKIQLLSCQILTPWSIHGSASHSPSFPLLPNEDL